jgi:hypothetical protein
VEVLAGGDAQFGEHLAEVPFDRTGTDVQVRADLRVGVSVPGQPGNVLLLRGELGVRVHFPLADLLTGGEQFPARAFGESVGADRGEQVVGGVQLVARVDPLVFAAQIAGLWTLHKRLA